MASKKPAPVPSAEPTARAPDPCPDAATLLRAIDGLIAALADPDAHDAVRCCDCPTLALATWRDRDWEARCDEHADRSGHELSYAPAVRTLRAAMEGRSDLDPRKDQP